MTAPISSTATFPSSKSNSSWTAIQRAPDARNPPRPANRARGQREPSFDALLQIMDGSSFLGSLFKIAMIKYIGSDPKLQAITKLAFIETSAA